MSKTDDIITDIEKAEGNGTVTNNPNDKGGRTQYGISEQSNPQAWVDGKVTEAEAREIYYNKYVKFPKFDQITNFNLQAQLIDFGVTSGSFVAIQKLQNILMVPVDGILGPTTFTVLAATDQIKINNELVKARIRMICQIVKKNPSQLEFLLGWCDRALSFLR
jgi:lysozyme family protein